MKQVKGVNMTDVNLAITRSLLRSTHAEVKRRTAVPNVLQACGVTKSGFGWFAEITVPGYPRFTWDGRAHNAYDARHKAWRAFMARHLDDRTEPLIL
jgi:hypothetical protein